MNILVTLERGTVRDVHFPPEAVAALEKLGDVRWNDTGEGFTQEEMARQIRDVDICLTHWGCPRFSEAMLEHADRLKMIAHAAGSVAFMVTDPVYEKGITVCSANGVMARYVAEGILGYILAGLRLIPQHDHRMKSRALWERRISASKSLIGARLALIGLGTVGVHLLKLLQPFDVSVKIYDPYISGSLLQDYPNAGLCPLDEALSWGDIVSVQASLTPETRHLLNGEKLKRIKDGALLVNASRGALIDQRCLTAELERGRLHAVLDVFEEEPLPPDDPLRTMDNVILMPHMAGTVAREEMTFAIIDEIGRWIANEPLQYEIPYEQYRRMTRSLSEHSVW